MVEVVATDEFADWYRSLREPDMEAVTESVEVLAEKGVDLGYPSSSAIQGSKYPLR